VNSSRSTIRDVAVESGVSISTVSKALNGTGRVAHDTQLRVADAAAKLGFLPPRRRRRSPDHDIRIGVLTCDAYGRFTLPILLGAEDAFGPGRATVLMCDTRDDPIREEFYLESFLRSGVDGIIATGVSNDPRPSLSAVVPIPVVYAFQPSEDPRDCSLVPDDHQAAALVVAHLRAIGRRTICYIGGPAKQEAVSRRHAGLMAALEPEGLALAHPAVFTDWSEWAGQEAVASLIRAHVSFDAVYCASDQLARGVVLGLRESGRSVPADVAVVGVDNWSVIAEAARPQLTTVDLQLERMGRRAAQLLAQARDGRPLPAGEQPLPCRLVRRGSTDVLHHDGRSRSR
jgi:LacI family transcriptional regulator